MKKALLALAALAALLSSCCNENKETTVNEMKYESANWKFGAETPIIDVKPGLQRQILCYNDNIMLVKVFFNKEMVGQCPPLHSHPHAQCSYVVSGKFEFHCGDKEPVILTAGDSYYIEPNTPHEAYCLEEGVLIDGFTPIREDFMK